MGGRFPFIPIVQVGSCHEYLSKGVTASFKSLPMFELIFYSELFLLIVFITILHS